MRSSTIQGHVIVPTSIDKIVTTHLSYQTFGITPFEAWCRHCQSTYSDPDISKKIQEWHDRGYRLRRATLTVEHEHDEQFS